MTTWFAPGRVELLGKHTDYAGGRSLLLALDRGVTVSVEDAADGLVATSEAAADEVELRGAEALSEGHWGNYLRTVVARLEHNFGPLPPARISVGSSLPLASGMSSSSALMVATALALAHHSGLPDDPRWRGNITTAEELATYLATIENGADFGTLTGRRGVGTFGGSQDHTAIICCRAGELALYSFRGISPRQEDTVAWDPDLVLVVAMSGVAAEKTGAARQHYNRLAELTAEITRRWNLATSRRDVNIGQALASHPEGTARLRDLLRDDPALLQRFEQFVTESEFCIPRAATALRDGDLAGFGEAVALSQKGADEGLDNQVPQTRFLVADALARGAIAASAFGAGFGGSVWAMVSRTAADDFADDWISAYRHRYPDLADHASVMVSSPHGGARAI